jgi:salicylate hydroxylase
LTGPTKPTPSSLHDGTDLYLSVSRYDFLASREKHSQGTRKEGDSDFESIIKARVAGLGFVAGGKMDWIYKNDIEQVWKEYIAGEQAARLYYR